MATEDRASSCWPRLPIPLRAIVSGLLIALATTNVWPLLLLKLGVPLAVIAEGIFLALYLWWAAGGGPPRRTQAVRATAFLRCTLSRRQRSWGIIAALFFAATIHASIALLFRLVSFPMAAAFRHGYDFSFILFLPLKWLAVVVSAISAAICEETGFRGYMQRPIEQRHARRLRF
jgi:membrane protease YdiL (CAAX protease family)